VGALLKAAGPGGPLAGFNVQRVYGTTHTGELPTYIAAVHPHAKLANGRPIYDGFVIYRHVGLTRMHQCGAAPAANDPRQILRNVNVPVIRIIPGETDALSTFARRREDSDAVGDRYRLYEVAGAPHADEAAYRYIPSREDQTAVGTQAYLSFWPFLNQCELELPMFAFPVMTYAGNAIFANLDRWVRDGVAPPRAARISIQNGGTPQAKVVTDEFGNAVGGVRSPYLDVPVATYHVSRPGGQLAPGVRCEELAYKEPFDWARLEAMYGSSRNYAAKVAESVDRLVRERWLTESDGRKVRTELVVPLPSSR
jgi:hypothetical protein